MTLQLSQEVTTRREERTVRTAVKMQTSTQWLKLSPHSGDKQEDGVMSKNKTNG